jgi:hypothetical protein
MKIKTNSKYISKYDKIIKKYSIEEIQNLLDNCKLKIIYIYSLICYSVLLI